ncbi:hypothetical protein D3C86_1820610 [compost metagenome]
MQSQIRVDRIVQRNILLEHDRFHGEKDALHRFTPIENGINHTDPGIIHLGEIQQVIGERLHALGFRFNAVQPFRLIFNRVIAVSQEHVCVGVNDG